jgi:hypothetical protein
VRRRAFLTGVAAGCLAPAASAHTLYGQWVVYRRKHLLIGCHRKDPETFPLAERLAEAINHALPKAKARAARAPHPERLASLIGTDQMEVAVLSGDDAVEMAAGTGRFAPYGKLPLTRLAEFGPHLLIAHADFPKRHGWMLASALSDAEQTATDAASIGWHAGALSWQAGEPLPPESD